ncbi:conserved hypothetical protein [Methanococcus maripaludis C5]|uniref:Uncharacterized protein n=1 Tax=Methanococcus maripaludis (strain C5 / ATCC BAA-1333) TaxID=402880 RepID=A4G0N7_METM5|nr:hypothetical protein [Methanococcus maripaludis]ABO36021.1 conserved hypothetical protein [Methanococcus maripaludis C5]
MDYQTLLLVLISGIIGYVFTKISKSMTGYYMIIVLMCTLNTYVLLEIALKTLNTDSIVPVIGFSIATMAVFEISRAYFDNSLSIDASSFRGLEEFGIEYYIAIILFYSALLFVFLLYIIPLGYMSMIYLVFIMLITSFALIGNSIVRYWAFELYIVSYLILTVGLILLNLIEIEYYPAILVPYLFILIYYLDMRAFIKKKASGRVSLKKTLLR